MSFQVLLSCMEQKDFQIIETSNLKGINTLIINQTKECCEHVESIDNAIMIYSHKKGLSNSRNLAIKNATGDICLLSDDDEKFVDNVDKLILNAFDSIPQADILIFKIINYPKKIKNSIHKMSRFELLKVSSVQIVFRAKSIKNVVEFDSCLGAGTINSCGEENNFLLKAWKKKLKIYYYPESIGELLPHDSSWFSGYNERYFFKRGKISRYNLGFIFGFLYSVYFLFFKRKLYKQEISFFKAFKYTIKGIFAKDITTEF